jgi:hypothetical protein
MTLGLPVDYDDQPQTYQVRLTKSFPVEQKHWDLSRQEGVTRHDFAGELASAVPPYWEGHHRRLIIAGRNRPG